MIVGLGLDIAEIDRIEAAIRRHGVAFLERLFTPAEVSYCEGYKHKFERYAARFAAKEAAMKALGTGWSHGVRWRDIEVTREPTGKPTLRLSRSRTSNCGPPGRKEYFGVHHPQRQSGARPSDFRKLTSRASSEFPPRCLRSRAALPRQVRAVLPGDCAPSNSYR